MEPNLARIMDVHEDPEVQAIGQVYEIVRHLDGPAQDRLIRWLSARCERDRDRSRVVPGQRQE